MVRALVLVLALAPAVAAQELEIVHLNVSQGDATLILGPVDGNGDRVTVLVDAGDITSAGDPDGGATVLSALNARGITQVDFMIVTHYDSDHLGGLVTGGSPLSGSLGTHGTSFMLGPNNVPGDLGDDDGDGDADWILTDSIEVPDPEELGTGDDIGIGRFVDRGDASAPTTLAYRKYRALAVAHSNRTSLDGRSEVEAFEIDLGGGATMRAVAANGFVHSRNSRVASVNTENERSLAFLVEFGEFDYFIGGDLIGRSAGGENARVERAVGEYLDGEDIEIDVLHVGHHGADNASDSLFLALIRPEVAIVSLGNGNTHGHPNADALSRLATAGVTRIFQTEWGTTEDDIPESVRERQAILQGNIFLTTDGSIYTISMAQAFGAGGS